METANVPQIRAGNTSFAAPLAFVATGALRGPMIVKNEAALINIASFKCDGVGGKWIRLIYSGLVSGKSCDDFRVLLFFCSLDDV